MVDLSDVKQRMDGAIEAFKRELGGLRTGRASAGLVENVMVEVYGSHMPLPQVATINVPESRMLSVQVWDQGNVAAVEKAIMSSGLGLNPSTEGNLIRLPLPDLTEERRKELVKVASKYLEQAKVAVRNVRRDGMDLIKKAQKDGDISEDDARAESDNVQKMTDNHISKLDEMYEHKEKDIMTI